MSNEALAMAAKNGDSDALAQLWEQVKDYAYTIVMRYTAKPYADTEDYLQTAFLGVRAAALAFDPDRGNFLTVADWYIRRACSSFYCWHRQGEIETISYDVPMNADDPDGGDFRDNFPDESIGEPTEDMEQADIRRDVRAAVGELSQRQQGVIIQHYYKEQPLMSIGKTFGVSLERIRQIEKSALKHLSQSEHLVSYKREYAPHKGVGVCSFRNNGGSAVEWVAIKNLDAERRAFSRQLLDGIKKGWYTQETADFMLQNHMEQYTAHAQGLEAASGGFID